MAELKDTGNRRDFGTGAVRDMAEGKGRCDLLPLDIIWQLFPDGDDRADVFYHLYRYQENIRLSAQLEVYKGLYEKVLTGKFSV